MAWLIRSWNLFHGNADPPRRHSFLRDMLALVVADDPDVVCLQEVPAWALPRLAPWTGYQAFPGIARRGLWPASAAGWITRRHQGLLRSAIAGQANAVLVARRLEAAPLGSCRIDTGPREPRIVLAVRVTGIGVVANVHASQDTDAAAREVERARAFAESQRQPGEAVVLAGDFNARIVLAGYSAPGPGIDHVVVLGRETTSPVSVWPLERRVQNGVVLSDHAPVEVTL